MKKKMEIYGKKIEIDEKNRDVQIEKLEIFGKKKMEIYYYISYLRQSRVLGLLKKKCLSKKMQNIMIGVIVFMSFFCAILSF